VIQQQWFEFSALSTDRIRQNLGQNKITAINKWTVTGPVTTYTTLFIVKAISVNIKHQDDTQAHCLHFCAHRWVFNYAYHLLVEQHFGPYVTEPIPLFSYSLIQHLKFKLCLLLKMLRFLFLTKILNKFYKLRNER